MENEKNKKSPAWLGRLCALFTAFVVCAAFCSLAFVRPSMPVKSDAGNYVSYYAEACADYISTGFTPSALSSGFGVALGSQLMLLMIADQCQRERESRPGATLNLTNYSGLTGFYTVGADYTTYYPMTLCIDKNLQDNVMDGQYTAMDGGINCIKATHFNLKYYATGYPQNVIGSVGDSGGYLQCDGSSAAVLAIPTGSTSLFNSNWAEAWTNGGYVGTWLRYASNTYPNYNVGTSNIGDWVAFRSSIYGQVMAGYVGGYNDNIIDGLPDLEVSPDNLPLAYDTIIEDIPVPYRIFPDGFPVENPTETNTEDTTESGDDNQPFTLPPEWLETYTFPLETFPTIPFTDVDTPTFDISNQTEGINFWFVFAKKIFDSNEGLKNFLLALLGIAVAGALLWRLGSHGGDNE